MRTSHMRHMPMPAPTARPLTIAMTGLSTASSVFGIRWMFSQSWFLLSSGVGFPSFIRPTSPPPPPPPPPPRPPRAAGAPASGDHDHVDLIVRLRLGERPGPRVDHRPGERVELVGPVQRDGRDPVLDVVEQLAHAWLSFPAAKRCHSPGTPLRAFAPPSP